MPGIQDTQCGFKAFRGDVARRLFALQTIAGFAFDVEILYLARKHGYRISEVPIRADQFPATCVMMSIVAPNNGDRAWSTSVVSQLFLLFLSFLRTE